MAGSKPSSRLSRDSVQREPAAQHGKTTRAKKFGCPGGTATHKGGQPGGQGQLGDECQQTPECQWGHQVQQSHVGQGRARHPQPTASATQTVEVGDSVRHDTNDIPRTRLGCIKAQASMLPQEVLEPPVQVHNAVAFCQQVNVVDEGIDKLVGRAA